VAKKIISTKGAPAAIGPYSQGVAAESFVFTSGQIPIDPSTGKLVEGDIGTQMRRVMENLKAVLAAANLSLADVVKTTIYVKDMSQFAAINRVYAEYFPDRPPARSTVGVASLALNAGVEIDMIAWGPRA